MKEAGSLVIITGATAGIGAACARRFAAEGHRVVLLGRREDRLSALASDLGATARTLDVRHRAEVERVVGHLVGEFGPPDVLIANAGLALGLEPAPRADLDDWEAMVDTNIKGVLFVVRAALPSMVSSNRGHIFTLGSVAGSYPYPGGNVYGATKAFTAQFSLNLRADLLGTAVRVTSIEPGLVETEFSDVRFGGDTSRAKKVYEGMTPMTGEDIAELIYFCWTRPPHVNVNRLEVMATAQAFGPFAVHRK
jgi:NADP-dependent 3-hydroxy acid dehydrogenase YdfG